MSVTVKDTAGKPAADDKSSARKDEQPTTARFTIDAASGYHIPLPNCCSGYDVEVHVNYDAKGNHDMLTIFFTHSLDCDVWQYV